jgi:NAD(P)-dependent dehydrogenase (short-subunit alcohol dehydrogenase family)
MSLKGKTAVITGAGRGIGAAAAKLLAASGVNIVLASRTEKELRQVAADIEKAGGVALAVPTDIADESSVEKLFQQSKNKFGPVDILVNNAGYLKVSELVDQRTDDWDRTFAVNLRGTFLCSREAFRQMKEAKHGGAIVNVSSLAGIRGVEKFSGTAAYVASKHGVVGLTEVLSLEGKPLGIRVNCIAPGAVDTQIIRENFPAFKATTKPEEIASIILFLCDGSRSGAMTGGVVEVHCNP